MSNSIILGIDLGGIIICCIFLNDALRENRPLKTIVIYTLFTFLILLCLQTVFVSLYKV